MLKDFWEEKKHSIQFLGILIGVGAIFLNVPLSENPAAASALLSVQLGWLLIITLGQFLLFFQLLIFALEVEAKYEIKDSLNYLVVAISFYILWNLWKYIYSLYRDELKELLGSLLFDQALLWFFINIGIYIHKRESKNILWQILAFYIITSPVFSFWFRIKTLNFVFLDWAYSCSMLYVALALIFIPGILYLDRKQKKKVSEI